MAMTYRVTVRRIPISACPGFSAFLEPCIGRTLIAGWLSPWRSRGSGSDLFDSAP